MHKLPESDDHALCWIVEGPITQEGYDHKFLPAFHEIIDKRGALYMVVWFHNYEGWDEGAILAILKRISIMARKLRAWRLSTHRSRFGLK